MKGKKLFFILRKNLIKLQSILLNFLIFTIKLKLIYIYILLMQWNINKKKLKNVLISIYNY